MASPYNTEDVRRLLELKRLESKVLLEVVQTINLYELHIEQLCMIVRNTLRAQLGVRRVSFYYMFGKDWREGFRVGFAPLTDEAVLELLDIQGIVQTTLEASPVLQAMRVEYAIPIKTRNEIKAYFIVAEFAETEAEVQNDLLFIETLGHILYVAIYNKQLFEERMGQENLRKELEVAETIQRQLLLSDFGKFKGMDIFALNVPHHGIGGDFYDVIQKGEHQTFVAIADVSGKGIAAALLMSNLQANLRALCAQYNHLPTIVHELNAILHSITNGEKFVTLFIARINTEARAITYVNAGHNFPLLLQPSRHTWLESSCLLLGILPTIPIHEASLPYAPGDILFLFTDGVVEQHNPQDELFGSERLAVEVARLAHTPSAEIIQGIRRRLDRFADQAEVSDDLTMLCVKFI